MDAILDELETLEVLNYEQQPFVPYEAVKSLLTVKKTEEIVFDLSCKGQFQVYQQQEIVRSICSNGLRLFATLLSFSRPELIVHFIEHDHYAHGQLDSRLPLSKLSLDPILKDDYLCSRFDKHQWKFLPPFLNADQSHRELEDGARLPYVKCKRLDDGAFGEVFQMSVLASCQNLIPQKDGEVLIV